MAGTIAAGIAAVTAALVALERPKSDKDWLEDLHIFSKLLGEALGGRWKRCGADTLFLCMLFGTNGEQTGNVSGRGGVLAERESF